MRRMQDQLRKRYQIQEWNRLKGVTLKLHQIQAQPQREVPGRSQYFNH